VTVQWSPAAAAASAQHVEQQLGKKQRSVTAVAALWQPLVVRSQPGAAMLNVAALLQAVLLMCRQ
jgi:hypothetical protein